MFEIVSHHLWTVSWQVCVLAALALLAERMYRNAPPSFRYWLWMLVLARMCVPFDIPLPVSIGDMAMGTIGSMSASFNIIHGVDSSTAVLGADPFAIAGILWLIGTGIMLGFAAVRFIRTRRFLAEIEPVERPELHCLVNRLSWDMGIRKTVGLYITRNRILHAPAVTGVIHPKIVLSREFASWLVEDLEPVLLHELVHVRRNDFFFNRVQFFLQGVYFFHPFAWLANARIRAAREEICDDAAISFLRMERERYSLSMIRVGEAIQNQNRFSFAEVSFSERKSSLGERIRRIMDGKYISRRRMSAGPIVVLCAVLAFGVVLACGNSGNLAAHAGNAGYQAASEATDIQIFVESDGKYRISGKLMKKDKLEQAIRRQLTKSSKSVIISGVPDAPIEAITFAMDSAVKAGAEGLATTPDINRRMVDSGKAVIIK